jgi:hypothetical protein
MLLAGVLVIEIVKVGLLMGDSRWARKAGRRRLCGKQALLSRELSLSALIHKLHAVVGLYQKISGVK